MNFLKPVLVLLLTALLQADSHIIPLKQGWNLISTGLIPDSAEISSIFQNTSQMLYVMGYFRSPQDNGSEGFRTYMNIEGIRDFSTLTTMDFYHGYWVYMSLDATLEITGVRPSDVSEMTLSPGWNLCGYWKDTVSSLPSAQNQTGTVIDPVFNLTASAGIAKYIMGFYSSASSGITGFRTFMNSEAISFSTLSSLDPCHGYWFYMNSQAKLKFLPDLSFSDKVLTGISVTPASATCGTKKTFDLSQIQVTASYSDGSVLNAFSPVWSIVSGSGLISGSTFTASDTPGQVRLLCSFTKGTITATSEISLSVYEDSRSLNLVILPSDAITAGAAFSVNGGIWNQSGTSVILDSNSSYTVTFKNAGLFTIPESITGILSDNTEKTAYYTYSGSYPRLFLSTLNQTPLSLSVPSSDTMVCGGTPVFDIPAAGASFQLVSAIFDASHNTKNFTTALHFGLKGSVSSATIELATLSMSGGTFSIPANTSVKIRYNQNGTQGEINYNNSLEKIFSVSGSTLNLNVTSGLSTTLYSFFNSSVPSGRIYDYILFIKDTHFFAAGDHYNRITGQIQYIHQ